MEQRELDLKTENIESTYAFFDVKIVRIVDTKISPYKYFANKDLDISKLSDKDSKHWQAKHSATDYIYTNKEKKIEIRIAIDNSIRFISTFPYEDKHTLFYEIMQDVNMKKLMSILLRNKNDFIEEVKNWWV